jgi:UDP-3-O-acyl-N-acetylglucosamine deacetylase
LGAAPARSPFTTRHTARVMERTELKHPVVVAGPSFLGRATRCVLEPVRQRGIHLRLPDGEIVALGDMTLSVNRLFRFLTLRRRAHVLRIPEHLLGLLFALGLDSVVIALDDFRLPYDGRAKLFWDAIKPARQAAGTLDWVTPAVPLEIGVAPGRSIALTPAAPGGRRFDFGIEVGYPELGARVLRGTAGEERDHERLAASRPYWQTQTRRRAARLARHLGWPQGDIGVWLRSDDPAGKAAVLEELCWHRLLDMLGMFATVMPPGGRIAGTVMTRRVGHAADIDLMRAMKGTKLVPV